MFDLLILTPIMILLAFTALAFVIFLIIAWIWMIIDCLQRDFKEGSERIAWILILIFLSFIGLILYYFIVFRKSLNKNKKKR